VAIRVNIEVVRVVSAIAILFPASVEGNIQNEVGRIGLWRSFDAQVTKVVHHLGRLCGGGGGGGGGGGIGIPSMTLHKWYANTNVRREHRKAW